jgi:peptidoglycan/LPS O-acetylase OafA/YrhL
MQPPSGAGAGAAPADVATRESDGRHKLNYLQGLRGCAAVVVVLHHYVIAFYPGAIFDGAPRHTALEQAFLRTPLGAFISGRPMVCLFFILSGYVLSLPYFGPSARSLGDLWAAAVKRPIRLVGLVIATMLASLLLARGGCYFDGPAGALTGAGPQPVFSLGWPSFLRDLRNPFASGTTYNESLWTITTELIGSYLVFGLVLLVRRGRFHWWLYLLAGALLLRHSLYLGFVLGVLCADLATRFPAAGRNRPWVTVSLTIVGVYLAGYPRSLEAQHFSATCYAWLPPLADLDYYAIAGAFGLFLAVLVSPWWQSRFASGAAVYLGRVSFALYAVHLLILRSVACWIFLQLYARSSYAVAVALSLLGSAPFLVLISHGLTVWFDEPAVRAANAWGRLCRRGFDRARRARATS